MDWNAVNKELIKHNELLLSLDFLKGYDLELSVMNDSNVRIEEACL
jgi:hypothetical protein